MEIQWYPGHMTKARRQMQSKLKLVDIIIEVLDARAPKSSLNPDFDDLFAGKLRLYVLNKSDLADEAVTNRWIEHFRKNKIPTLHYFAKGDSPARLKSAIEKIAADLIQKNESRGVHKTLRAMVVGIPNVGKSAILNRLSGSNKMKEGNKPGVTKGLQWAKIDTYLEILDSPGLLWPKFEDEHTGAVVALIGSIKLDILDEEALAYYLVKQLSMSAPHMLIERYKLDYLDEDANLVLQDIGRKRGFLVKGGDVDMERAAKTVLDEFKNGKMGRISLEVPEEVN